MDFKFLKRIAIDPIYMPPERSKWNGKISNLPDKIFENNKFELIFDEIVLGNELK